MRTVIFTVLFAFIAQLAFAIPPACLLHAVNTQDEPGDLNSVCGHGALTVQSHMAVNCGKWEQDAQKAFIATCSSAGRSVGTYLSGFGDPMRQANAISSRLYIFSDLFRLQRIAHRYRHFCSFVRLSYRHSWVNTVNSWSSCIQRFARTNGSSSRYAGWCCSCLVRSRFLRHVLLLSFWSGRNIWRKLLTMEDTCVDCVPFFY